MSGKKFIKNEWKKGHQKSVENRAKKSVENIGHQKSLEKRSSNISGKKVIKNHRF